MAEHVGEWIGWQFSDYRLVRFLGRGSFGDVYLGEHVSNEKSLTAIKVLHIRLTDISQRDVTSFIAEARTVLLTHPNIVRILDFNIKEKNIPYLIMEYAPNGTLRQRHPRGRRVPLPTIVDYIKQISSALQYAHTFKVIHRDVKPENILLGPNFETLLSDFGIATAVHSTRSRRTDDKAGTPLYMAPEQIQGSPCPASDQYALGIITYEWLCGECPFTGTDLEIAIKHQIETPASLREKVPGLSSEVEQVIMKALAKKPEDRFPDIETFASTLEDAVNRNPPIGTTLMTYDGHNDEVKTLAWSPDELHIVSGSADKTAQVWLPTWKNTIIDSVQITTSYTGHTKSVDAVAWSPDGQRVASASLDGTVHVWDVATSNVLLKYTKHTRWVRAVAWSPDGKYLASGGGDRSVQVWNTETKEQLLTYRTHDGEIRTLAWSPNGMHIASGSADKTVHVWNARTGQILVTYQVHTKSVNTVAWSPDGRCIVSGSLDGSVHIWDADTGNTLLIYTDHSNGVNTVAWSPQGPHIASGARDSQIHIWEADTGNCIYTYSSHSNWIMALAWSPDGKHIASGSVDRTVHIWRAV